MTIVLSFSYIHAVGCDCASDIGGPYAERLSRLRHRALEEGQDQNPDITWDDICQWYPSGSCLAWADGEHGWPGDHRDYDILRLYHEAMRLRGTGAAAWGAIDGGRSTRHERLPEQYDPPWTQGCFDDVPRRDLWGEDDRVLVEAYYAANAVEEEAFDLFMRALRAAPYGAQPDGSFITRHTAYQIASGRYVHTLHAPAKQGPLAEVIDCERGDGATLRALRTMTEARALREEERAKNRVAARDYATRRKYVGRLLGTERVALPYVVGQNGGTVSVHIVCDCGSGIDDLPQNHSNGCPASDPEVRNAGQPVSALGALRAAGLSREAADRVLYDSWARLGLSYDTYDKNLMLTLRGIERA